MSTRPNGSLEMMMKWPNTHLHLFPPLVRTIDRESPFPPLVRHPPSCERWWGSLPPVDATTQFRSLPTLRHPSPKKLHLLDCQEEDQAGLWLPFFLAEQIDGLPSRLGGDSFILLHLKKLSLILPFETFMDLQFPNGQLTYVAGEGLTTSAFLPLFGGLLQAQGQYPGETRFSFSCNNKSGTRITPMVQWPDKSFSLGVVQALAWKRSGLMLRPTIQFSICPTFGGSNPGLHAELIHSLKEKLSVNCGCSCTIHPSAFASLALGRSKWNGNSGSSGIVLRAETPLNNIGLPSFSVQLNFGVEF